MKALLTALAIPLMIAAPVVAHADPGGPPAIFTPQQECDATKKVVDLMRTRNPHATPEQIADGYNAILDKEGAFTADPNGRDRQRQYILDHISSCHL